ncbi:exosortase N [Chitinophaga agri]|uniref:Exosortase N n=1 Tax=Chitinophaga agri TaxID=2703787 RepID=A0A6B9Z7W9_9BACT|nr:exosortase N [Chitinophaga agri]QHS58087.1 exosortase N [Chitinophaga agri]
MSKGILLFLLKLLQAGRCWPLLVMACYVVVMFYGLGQYIPWNSPATILGVLALCMVTTFNRSEKGSLRFFLPAVLALLLYMLLPGKTLLCTAVVCGILFMAEAFFGRVNLLPGVVLVIMSPLFEYVSNVFSFPIRLQLTTLAGRMIGLMGQDVYVQGNMISCNGNEFSVDPACMGLQMMVTSLLCGIILIGYYQRQQGKELRLPVLLPLLSVFLLLNILSNLLRIIFLVWMHILPETAMHDVSGLMCLGLYVITPAVFLSRWTVSRYGHAVQSHRKQYVLRSAVKMFLLNTILPVAMLISCILHSPQGANGQLPSHVPALAGFAVQPLPGNIIRLQSDSLLIYIKHIPASYYTEHHPMICWRGSGYNFYKVQETPVSGHTIYTALLQQEQDVLYTAWWYDNGSVITNSQLQWRWDVLFGAHPYSLVNVTAGTEQELTVAVQEMLNKKKLSVYL